ncbi:MAG: ABC transporter permease [bacterium]|nr:ABC transporter permease [bacterium]MCM1375456.1 ABC transporter permease [Muribaculum sp.]
MLNCIKSELYHIFHTKSVYMLTGVCLLLMLLFSGGLWAMATFTGDFPWATTKYAFSTLEADMHIPLFLSAIMGSVVASDDLKHRTVNNAVAFGLSREQVFLAKLVVGIVASALCLLVTEAALIGGGYLLLENSGPQYTLSLLRGTAACIPVWIGGMIAYISLYYVTGSTSAGIWSWLLVMVAVPVAVSILGMKFEWCARLTSWLYYSMVSAVTPTEEWLEFAWSTPAGFLRCQESGIIGMAIFVTVGILAIRRREL